MTVSPTLFNSKSVEWETPQDLFDRLNVVHQFTLDVCATPANAKCGRYFTSKQDGLTAFTAGDWWRERVWCNPPYGRGIGDWVLRCCYATAGHRYAPSLAVMLLPARTDTKWWHDYVIPFGHVEFIRGRLKFSGHKNPAPFPSAVVTFECAP